jgi:aspartate-semialdehyde dehydrogenase
MTRAKWLLIGGETLLGKEIRELVEERKLPVDLVLASAGPQERVLTGSDGELAVIPPLDDISVEDARVLILAGAAETHREAHRLALAARHPPALIDATGALEDLPAAHVCAPVLDRLPAGGASSIHVPAHPVAVALARLLAAFPQPRVARCVVAVFEPASERGRAGLDELHQQTVNLLNLKALPKEVFDAQAAFNLLPRYGPDAPLALAAVERRIAQHLDCLVGPLGLGLPSLRLLHAPVFHGYSMVVWLQFGAPVGADDIAQALTGAGFEVRGPDQEPGSNTSTAGQSGITLSDITPDRNAVHAFWLWLAFDNLRAHADNVLLTAALLSRPPKGDAPQGDARKGDARK